MKTIRIDILRGGPGGTDPRTLVRTMNVSVESMKQLTADRARRVLIRTIPEFADQLVIRHDTGWMAQRPIAPIKGSNYLYTWEYAVVNEADREP